MGFLLFRKPLPHIAFLQDKSDRLLHLIYHGQDLPFNRFKLGLISTLGSEVFHIDFNTLTLLNALRANSHPLDIFKNEVPSGNRSISIQLVNGKMTAISKTSFGKPLFWTRLSQSFEFIVGRPSVAERIVFPSSTTFHCKLYTRI